MKKFLIFILTIILLSLIGFTGCLFYNPCKTKIKEFIPEKYHSYIDKFDLNNNNIEENNQKVSMNIGENGEVEINKDNSKNNEKTKEAEKKLDEITKKLENNDKNEIEKTEEKNLKSGEKNKEEIQKTTEIETKEKQTKKTEENIKNDSSKKEELSEQEKKKREEYRQKLLARLNKDKPKEKEIVKEKTITMTVDGKEKKVKVAKLLGNGFYFTQDKNNTYLYFKDQLLYTIKNSTDFFDKQEVNENPDLITDGPVIRAEILKKFSIKKLGDNVFLLTQKKYEENKLFLIDTKNNKFIPLKRNFSHDIEKAEIAKKGIVFLVNKKYYEGGVYYINRNTKIVLNIFKNSDNSIDNESFSYKKAKDFKIIQNSEGNPITEINISGPKGVDLIKHIEF